MLKFIGTGDLFNIDLANTSAYTKDKNGNLLLIDCGVTVFSRLCELELLNDVNNLYVVITHMHPDHVGALASLVFYAYFKFNLTTNIILTTDDSAEGQEHYLSTYLELQGVSEDMYEFVYSDMTEGIIQGLNAIELIPIMHCETLNSYAVELKFDDRCVYFVGDNNDKDYLKSICQSLKENDIIYTDCAINKSNAHISLEELLEIFPQEKRGQVVAMHFNDYASINMIKSYGFKIAEREFSKQELLKLISSKL